MKRLFSAIINSLRGIRYGFRSEAALREEMVLLAAGFLLSLAIAPSVVWYVMMVGSLLTLLAVEFLNTGIEKLADYVTRERHVEILADQGFRFGRGVLRDMPCWADLAGGARGTLRADLTAFPLRLLGALRRLPSKRLRDARVILPEGKIHKMTDQVNDPN